MCWIKNKKEVIDMQCPICSAVNLDGAANCFSCGMQLNLIKKGKKEKIELSPSFIEDFGGAHEDFLDHWTGGREKKKETEEIKEEVFEVSPLNDDENIQTGVIEWEKRSFSEKYGKLIELMAEEVKNISFIVSGGTEGDSVSAMTKYERESVTNFLRNRPDQLTENALMSTPETIGDLIAVYEAVKCRIEPRYTGAISTIDWCLNIFRQIEMYINAPSQTRN
jgi:hypothetical protein